MQYLNQRVDQHYLSLLGGSAKIQCYLISGIPHQINNLVSGHSGQTDRALEVFKICLYTVQWKSTLAI